MTTKSNLAEVSAFARKEIEAHFPINPKSGSFIMSDESSVTLQIRKAFRVECALYVSYKPSRDSKQWLPVVTINAPSLNCPVALSTAFVALLQEVTMFGAILQAQLDEFEIPFE